MHKVIHEQILPLVGKVHWEGFNPNAFGSVMSLQTKLLKHVAACNKDKVRSYLAICIKHWPSQSECPVDRELITRAVRLLE